MACEVIKALRGLDTGSVVEVITKDDKGLLNDLGTWCRATGHELAGEQPGQGQVRVLIRKGEPVRNDRAMTVVMSTASMSTASLEHAVDLLDKALAGPVLGMDVARARQAHQRDVGARRRGQRQASSHGGRAGAVPADGRRRRPDGEQGHRGGSRPAQRPRGGRNVPGEPDASRYGDQRIAAVDGRRPQPGRDPPPGSCGSSSTAPSRWPKPAPRTPKSKAARPSDASCSNREHQLQGPAADDDGTLADRRGPAAAAHAVFADRRERFPLPDVSVRLAVAITHSGRPSARRMSWW